ncbi:Methylcrotonyl-CoA carboxylase biotin-containing subunit [Actinokineospora spheciospongiae]|uniref:Methylcrotonyl-CoA carboxylase biotin-containing subunit n=1 Tax=Actinokineospora spheciospongiae TaxID=909613 RepID=W7IWW7_9PSEU|nr:biotin carboxylase N-terminal domain-containing protein [Actinokineospora spheciospongiae]EWC60951.1 Methylcrotonyl-CoA carboxylase biotin-containing subunit [Actinokineospora spheciospongiae]
MITSLLVANRGEIARRVFRTARDLGIATVAVHSDADADSPHVREADAAVRLPGSSPAETYLRPDLLIRAALDAGADAVHPGYGFLSENAEFARAVLAAGLTWVGPPVEAIERMGSKIESKLLMAEAGVPTLTDVAEPTEADLPLLVKASAGGGGRGMRVVRRLADLDGELAAARSEAASAFGDPTVFVEPYLETGHHIEVQVMADRHGTVWAVGERECSIQRRHQKVVEEAPSPLVERTPGMRERLFDAARKAAGAIGYEGAGTVEFLADDAGRFYFLEMNTRLQVEHPVTECVTGLDLVALQLSVAEGAPLAADPPESAGHAIEVRLYAEDPALDWRPQSGTLHHFAVPGVTAHFTAAGERGLRLDSGVESGSVVGVHYDPMLAKVIAWAPDRTAAARALAGALAGSRVHGVHTNRDLLVRVLRHPAFLAGETDTAFFDRHGLGALSEPLADKDTEALSALAAALADAEANRAAARVLGRVPGGWRNVVSQPQVKVYTGVTGEHEVRYRVGRAGLAADGFTGVRLVSATARAVELEVAGVRRRFEVTAVGGSVWVDSALGPVALTAVDRFPDPADQVAAGSLLAPMPGTVVRVAVSAGDSVTAGQPLLWLEAMKMEHRIDAPTDGVVAELPVSAGDQVDVGRVLAVVRTAEEGS